MLQFDPGQLATWCGGEWESGEPAQLTGVSNNTRTLAPGDLYVAIRGERLDGHAFVGEAFQKGASAAVVDAGYAPETQAGPLLRVADSVEALGAMASGYRDLVTPVMVGVTGSVGKSTVKEMTAAILSGMMPTAKTRGNWNNNIGLPLSLLSMEPDTRAGVFEVGMNHPGEIEDLCRVLRPEWGVVTSIGPVHLEHFESVDEIAREKASLLEALPDDGHAVLCCDDAYFDLLRERVGCELHTVSLSGDANYAGTLDAGSRFLKVRESACDAVVSIPWTWPGKHNALNALYAIAVGRGIGLDWRAIASGLANYRPLGMRWETEEVDGVRVINDAYNANPLSMRAALRTFDDLPGPGAKWLVLGGMYELGEHAEEEHEALGREVAQGAWAGVIVVGDFGESIATGARKAGLANGKICCCGSSAEAAGVLRDRMQPGDAVLLKASRGVALEDVVEELKR
jgi:UDP-N-acetylmuramoyl-tripeptide--D-alanyl-D-alanine ligase